MAKNPIDLARIAVLEAQVKIARDALVFIAQIMPRGRAARALEDMNQAERDARFPAKAER
jgi:hypothetical protein